MLILFYIITLMCFAITKGNQSDGKYWDSVINFLLSDDEQKQVDDLSDEKPSGEQPYFDKGLWKCGKCDVIDESKLIYSESNEFEINNIDYDYPTVVQVGLTMNNMKCITVQANGTVKVQLSQGSCVGDGVVLNVSAPARFIVNVYGDMS